MPPPCRPPEVLERQGGDATVHVDGRDAFAQPAPGLSDEDLRTFAIGNNFFNDNWVTAPASTTGRDGLGPIFNAQSCSSCHFKDGRGEPPTDGRRPGAGPPHPAQRPGRRRHVRAPPDLGDQLQDRAIRGIDPEGAIRIRIVERPGRLRRRHRASRWPSRTTSSSARTARPLPDDLLISPRLAPPVFGVGLLEAVPAADIEAAADPDDEDDDGISGRTNHIVDTDTGERVLGRFGWKAAVPSVRDQVAERLRRRHRHHVVDPPPAAVHRGPDRVPRRAERRRPGARGPQARPGHLLQPDAGGAGPTRGGEQGHPQRATSCSRRSAASRATRPSSAPATPTCPPSRGQRIRPYTDLLVHDLGAGLADRRPDGEATGREWRTPPLWGIGLVETVNGHTRFLHDGRARNLLEAILWHGGEARAARDRFTHLSADERADLLAFLESL